MGLDDEFNQNVDKLKQHYKEDPKRINRKLSDLIFDYEREKRFKEEQAEIKKANSKNRRFFAVIVVITILAGLLNIASTELDGFGFMYYFGLVFFLAGFYVATETPILGIIFLFSHGGTGLGIMLAPVIVTTLNSPLLTDGGGNIITYIAIVIGLIVASFASMIIYNVTQISKRLQESNDRVKRISFILITIAIVMTQLLPHIIKYLV